MRCSIGSLVVLSCLAIGLVLAQDTPPPLSVPFEGLDPVLLILGIEAPGDPARSIERGRFRYQFASDETRTLFAREPERYEIQLGGHCATMGAPTWGSPDRYTVHGGRIYLFGSAGCQAKFLAEPSRYAPADAAPLPAVAWRPPAPPPPPDSAALVALSQAREGERTTDWPQWGGPRRDFVARGVDLAEVWPASGPRVVWRRELGDGYSAIAVRAGRLYTMHRRGDEDVVVALDAATGRTIWEHAYAAPLPESFVVEYGAGPHATPLVTGGRVFSVGGTAILRALDAATGKLAWSHDLYKEYQGTLRVRGYASSPLAFGDLVIVPVGGPGHAVMAFRQADGSVAWSSGDFQNSCSSPILIDVDGATELVAFLYGEIVGLDPATGTVRWTHAHPTDYGLNVSTPVWGDDQVLVVSSAYGAGSRALRLKRSDGGTQVEELWYSRRLRIHFGNAVRAGNLVYGSSGDSGTALFTALDVRTGEPAWRDRQLSRASFVVADGKLVLLDEDGTLVLATPGPAGLAVLSRTKLFDGVAWTVPTIAGTTLYARDRRTIVALDLGQPTPL